LGGIPERVEQVYDHLARGAEEAGREASRDQIMLSYVLHVDEESEVAKASFAEGAIREFYEFGVGVNGRPEPEGSREDWYRDYADKHLIGSPEEIVERIASMQEVSGGFGGIIFMSREWAGIEASRRSWELFASQVAPKFA
jgi:limonene 1,2-monooxygenase